MLNGKSMNGSADRPFALTVITQSIWSVALVRARHWLLPAVPVLVVGGGLWLWRAQSRGNGAGVLRVFVVSLPVLLFVAVAMQLVEKARRPPHLFMLQLPESWPERWALPVPPEPSGGRSLMVPVIVQSDGVGLWSADRSWSLTSSGLHITVTCSPTGRVAAASISDGVRTVEVAARGVLPKELAVISGRQGPARSTG
jgi:hypothetical protein